MLLKFRAGKGIQKHTMFVQPEILKSIEYYAGLSDAELDTASKLIFCRAVAKGEIVLFEGEPADALYFVVSGMVKIFKTSAEGKEQILSIIGPWGSFNDADVFEGGTNHISAEAMTPVVLYGIKKDDLEVLLQDYPRVALNAVKVLAGHVRYLVSLVEDLSFKHVISRVAKILLERAGNGLGLQPRLTQQDMAAMAGTAREVIGRSLRALEEEGAIRMERQRIVVADKEALREIAGV